MKKKAFDGNNEESIKQKIVSEYQPTIWSDLYSEELREIHHFCMIKDQDKRISV